MAKAVAAELNRDWNATPPRAPDDVVVIDIRGKTTEDQ